MQGLVRNTALAWAAMVLVVVPGTARAATLKVACGQKSTFPTINSALKALSSFSPQGPNTVEVSGSCHENVVIQGFNRLTLIAKPGASINDASGGVAFVVDIEDSTDVSLRDLTVNGGYIGVFCGNFSICRFDGDTIQGASQAGVQVVQSRATFDTNTIQNNLIGITSLESSSVRSNGGLVVQQNQSSGVVVDTGSSFAAFGTNIQNNGYAGIEGSLASLLVVDSSITGNLFGILALSHSQVSLGGNTITGNGLNGVVVRDLSFVLFGGPNNITGHPSGLDVDCQPQFPATRGALTNIGGGVTNCVEP
jgi:hypothetical protein